MIQGPADPFPNLEFWRTECLIRALDPQVRRILDVDPKRRLLCTRVAALPLQDRCFVLPRPRRADSLLISAACGGVDVFVLHPGGARLTQSAGLHEASVSTLQCAYMHDAHLLFSGSEDTTVSTTLSNSIYIVRSLVSRCFIMNMLKLPNQHRI